MLNLLAAILVALTVTAFDTSAIFSPVHPYILAAAMLPATNIKPLLHTIADVMAALSCSRSTVYVLINTGRLEAIKILGATRITDASMQRLLSSAPRAQIAGNVETPQPRKRASRAAA